MFAFKKYFKDTENQYDAKLGFKKEIEEMKKLLIGKQQEFHSISSECSRPPAEAEDVHDKLFELLE
jgi:hypothetical protein